MHDVVVVIVRFDVTARTIITADTWLWNMFTDRATGKILGATSSGSAPSRSSSGGDGHRRGRAGMNKLARIPLRSHLSGSRASSYTMTPNQIDRGSGRMH